mgnify:CR=1 FL=1
MILKFQNSHGIEREIGRPNNEDEVMKIIKKFLDDRKFKSYYTVVTKEDDKITYDVGSHTEFFVLYLKEGDE